MSGPSRAEGLLADRERELMSARREIAVLRGEIAALEAENAALQLRVVQGAGEAHHLGAGLQRAHVTEPERGPCWEHWCYLTPEPLALATASRGSGPGSECVLFDECDGLPPPCPFVWTDSSPPPQGPQP